ncbi:MAG: hypothetical protein IKW35_05080 [Paludibacteraceae bacterium]|nr:hypothetical protein [Paludibacteraceae bacterium]
MSKITPSSPFASVTGKFKRTDRIYIRANKHTGQLYGIGMDHPNRVEQPTEAQQQAQARFRDTWKEVDTLLAEPTQRAEYERLFRLHITQARKKKKQPCASLRTFVFRLMYTKKG